ncbi:RILP-like protein 1 isoform X2 [Apostichopus japonicus]|uniref:RILP-like protein 1 isoform X2 n=1 Tax=Stichopus japonicus TaxID=307972 RepID=UPI003AB4270A
MSERTTEGVPALNVYQVAADIGKDFEGLIEKFGSDGFRDIMPKIIKSLEHLEESVKNAETLRENVCNLEEQLHRLEKESEQKEKENIQLIQEAEEAAEKKREDDIFWMKELSELQNENSLLRDQLSEKDGIAVKERVQEQEAVKVLMIMRQTVDKQRNQLRTLEKDATQKAADIDALQQQVDRLAKLNQNLHQKNELIQSHAQSLMKEKSQIMTEMKAMEKDNPSQTLTFDPKEDPAETQTQVNNQQSVDGMILIDPSDPNRPRFTLHELYHVLVERDELKLKLFLMEEDLKSEQKSSDKGKESPASDEQKSESSISKFFLSIFKSSKKKAKPTVRESSSGSSENNWEFLEKKDAPAAAILDDDSEENDPEKSLARFFEKANNPKDDELEMRELVEDHFSNDEELLSSEEGEGINGKDKEMIEGSTARRKLCLEDEGTDVDHRDENHNVNNNQSGEETDGQGVSTEDGQSRQQSSSSSSSEDQREECREEASIHSQQSSQDSRTEEGEIERSCDIVEL